MTQRSCLQWEQDGFPVQINLGQGMATFSVKLARQNKENKKRQTLHMNERGNLFKASTKIAGVLSVFKNKISVRVRGKSIFRAWETTWLSWLYICTILPGSSWNHPVFPLRNKQPCLLPKLKESLIRFKLLKNLPASWVSIVCQASACWEMKKCFVMES